MLRDEASPSGYSRSVRVYSEEDASSLSMTTLRQGIKMILYFICVPQNDEIK